MDIWNPEFCLESGILSWNPESRPEFGGIPNPVQDSWVVSDPSDYPVEGLVVLHNGVSDFVIQTAVNCHCRKKTIL